MWRSYVKMVLVICYCYSVSAKELDFVEATKMALENNNDLKSLRAQSSSFKYKSAQSMAPNSPSVAYQKNDISGFDPGAQASSETITLNYTLNFPGKSLNQSSSFKHQAESLREDSLAKEIELMSLLYVNMSSQYANEELIKVLTEEIKKSKDIIQIQEKKYSTGQVSQVDILNSRVTLAKIEQDLLTVRNEQSLLQNDFLNLLGRPEENYTAKKIEFSTQNFKILTVAELTEFMNKNKPALKSAQAQIESLKSSLNYASMQALPDFQFSAGVTQWNRPNAAPISGLTRDYNFGVSISIPLFFPMNELQGVNSAKADLQASEDKSKAVLAQATSDLINAHTSFQSSTTELDKMLKVVLPAAKASYQLTLSSYSMGKTDFLRLSESRSNYIQAQKDIITKKRSINQTYVQLLQIVGCDFERKEGPHACN